MGTFHKPVFLLIATIIFTAMAYAKVIDKVVAVVNGSIITLSELNNAIAMAKSKSFKKDENNNADIATLRRSVLDQLIEKKLVEQASIKAGITISKEEIDNAIEEVKKQNGMSQDELLVTLTKSGLTYKDYRKRLKDQIREVKFMRTAFRVRADISKEDIENYYRQNKNKFYEPVSYKVKIISFLDKDMLKNEKRATYVLKQLKAGKDFKKLAMMFSDAPNASNGGDMGYLKADEINEAIEAVLKKLSEGEFSGIIKTAGGLHIIKLEERKDRTLKPLSSVRDEIHSILFQQIIEERYKVWLKKMKKTSHIEIRL